MMREVDESLRRLPRACMPFYRACHPSFKHFEIHYLGISHSYCKIGVFSAHATAAILNTNNLRAVREQRI